MANAPKSQFAGSGTDAARPTLRRRVFDIIEGGQGGDRKAAVFDALLVVLIVLNIAAFVAETVPSLRRDYGGWLDIFETVSVVLFTLEYVARLWTAVEVPFLARLPPWRARLEWGTRSFMLIDLVAILPFYLGHMFAIDLRVLRVLRLLRFLKLSRYSPAMHTLVRVIVNERRALLGAGLLLSAAILFAATGIYYLEGDAQPDKFGSVPESAWWAVATLTTVGYGDVTPITPWGRVFGGLVMIFGLCVLALPVAIISTGFAQEVGRRDFVVTWSLMSRIPLLAELDHGQVAAIMPLLHAHNLPPKVEVIEKGSPGHAMYFVASGEVEMLADGERRCLNAGDVFGALAMIEGETHQVAFRTLTRCRLLKLYREDFRRLDHAHPVLTGHIRRTAIDRTGC